MCLEFKKQKEKNKSLTCTLTCSKQSTRDGLVSVGQLMCLLFLQHQEKFTVDEFSR